jgi:hypothetical protein
LKQTNRERISLSPEEGEFMRGLFGIGCLAVALGMASMSADAAPQRGPAKFYDEQGGFRGYAWCMQAGGDIFDCNYFNRAQCEMSASGRRLYCAPNPFAAYGSGARPGRGNGWRVY